MNIEKTSRKLTNSSSKILWRGLKAFNDSYINDGKLKSGNWSLPLSSFSPPHLLFYLNVMLSWEVELFKAPICQLEKAGPVAIAWAFTLSGVWWREDVSSILVEITCPVFNFWSASIYRMKCSFATLPRVHKEILLLVHTRMYAMYRATLYIPTPSNAQVNYCARYGW